VLRGLRTMCCEESWGSGHGGRWEVAYVLFQGLVFVRGLLL
jgi:hypothetical protein